MRESLPNSIKGLKTKVNCSHAMITTTEHSYNSTNRVIETFLSGTVNLTPIEYTDIPHNVLANAGIEFGEDLPIDYSARIVWDTRKIIITIGDYIIAEWTMGDKTPMSFSNDKGYGDTHVHSYIESLPVGIVSDVMGLLWPAL